jgi:signal transduction histidine kinase
MTAAERPSVPPSAALPWPRPRAIRPRGESRGWTLAAYAGILGGLAVMLVSAAQVQRGWAERRLAAERALRDHLLTAARTLAQEALGYESRQVRALLWPVLGAAGHTRARPLTLSEVSAFADSQLVAADLEEVGHRSYLRFVPGDDPAAPLRVEARGVLADDAVRARVLKPAVERALVRLFAGRGRVVHEPVPAAGGLPPLTLVVASERTRDGRVTALFGVSYARDASLAVNADAVRRTVPLLPASYNGVDWRSGRRAPDAAVRPDAGPLRATVAKVSADDNALLAIRVRDRQGRPLYAAPALRDTAGDAWRSPHAAELLLDAEGLVVEVALPRAAGDRLVAAAVPLDHERTMLGSMLALGALSAVAGAAGVQRQRQLARTRATFVTAVSHELRTPLAQICLLSDTLRERGAESPEQADRWLDSINREAHRLGDLVQNVLLFARGQQRRLAVIPVPTDLAALAREVVDAFAPLAAQRDVRVALDAPRAAWALVEPRAARHILLNLLDNALKYGPPGQTVTVHATADATGAMLTVDDQGPGVAEADRRRIWRPFVRATPEVDVIGGSGIGLSVVRQLAAAHGGRAEVRSAPGGGGRFVVRLPRARATPH